MNNRLDLDALRGQWHALDQHLDANLRLNAEAVRQTLSERMKSAFRHHSRWLSAGLIFDALAVTALVAFALMHIADLPYLLSAIALLLGLSVQVASDINEWHVLRHLNFDAPVIEVRAKIANVRRRRLRSTGMILLLAVALWTPFVLVIFRGIFGIDLYHALPWSVLAVNFALGIALIPLGFWLGRAIDRRFRDTSGYTQFINDAAGRSWNIAAGSWDAYADLREGIDAGEINHVLDKQSARAGQAARMAEPLRQLKRSLKCGIGLAIVPVILLATFNMTHGGMPLLIVSGVLLHLVAVAIMVSNIAHLGALSRLDASAPPARLAASLEWMSKQRERFARFLVIGAPLLAMPLISVIAKALFNFDVTTYATWPIGISVCAIAVLATIALARYSRRDPEHFAPRMIEAINLGTRRRTQAVITALFAEPHERD